MKNNYIRSVFIKTTYIKNISSKNANTGKYSKIQL